MTFHADLNAAINVLNRGRLEMEPFPAVRRIVERQKDGTVVFTEDRWKEKANPIRCGTDEPTGSAPCQSRGYSYASSPPSKPMNLARTSSDAAPGFPSLLEATTLRTSVMAPVIFWRVACISCCCASILW